MKYLGFPDIWDKAVGSSTFRGPVHKGVFLAGGITNCPDWQQAAIGMIEVIEEANPGLAQRLEDVVLLNPRREHWPIDDPNASEAQIKWERLHLNVADTIAFWFPHETDCPITLFELGAALYEPDIELVIGTHSDYRRRADVLIQTRLARPDVRVVSTLREYVQNLLETVLPNWTQYCSSKKT